MLLFFSLLRFFLPLGNNYLLIFSLLMRRSQPLSLLLFPLMLYPYPLLYPLHLLSLLPLLCRFIKGLKLVALCLMARPVHLLRLRPLFHLLICHLMTFQLHSAKVNELALNILLLISFLIIASPGLHSFASTLSSISIPCTYQQAMSISGWKHAMDEEMHALH